MCVAHSPVGRYVGCISKRHYQQGDEHLLLREAGVAAVLKVHPISVVEEQLPIRLGQGDEIAESGAERRAVPAEPPPSDSVVRRQQ